MFVLNEDQNKGVLLTKDCKLRLVNLKSKTSPHIKGEVDSKLGSLTCASWHPDGVHLVCTGDKSSLEVIHVKQIGS